MNESKNTKKALHASLVSLFLCIVMLIGTTFAWFTDSASTGINKIQAGNLEVELNYWDGDSWENAENKQLFNYTKWEPGYMEVQGLQVKNAGNLALKWKAAINSTKELSGLADVIDVYVKAGVDYQYKKPTSREDVAKNWEKVGTLRDFVNGVETTTYGSLKAEETADLGLALVMSTEAGNKYQGMDLGGDITVTIVATQDTVESDSFDNTYDENAEITVAKTASGLQKAINDIKESGTVILGNNIVLDKQVEIGAGQTVTLDLNQYKTTSEQELWIDNKANSHISVNGGNLTIDGNGAVMTKPDDTYAINIQDGGNCTINSGTFAGNMVSVYVDKGTLTINGGTFYIQQLADIAGQETNQYRYTINCNDNNYKNGMAKVVIKGGTFKNFDPSDSASENPHANFVAKGYHVTSEAREGATWYTVVKD